jgi:hypothetical protein
VAARYGEGETTQSSKTLDLAIIKNADALRPRFWAKVAKGQKED